MSIADKLITIAENEQKVYSKGNDDGFMEGWNAGYGRNGISLFPERFWEMFQEGGKRTDYSYAFQRWSAAHFSPKYDLTVKNGYQLFGNFNNAGSNYRYYKLDYDMRYISTKIDFSQATDVRLAFFCTVVKALPKLDFSNALACDQAFYMSEIPTIHSIVFPTRTNTSIDNMFYGASQLENIVIEGVIRQNNLNFQWSPNLTRNSLLSIIKALEDKTNTGKTWTLTIGSENLAKLSESDLTIAWNKGWEVV